MKKNTLIIALFASFALLFTGCETIKSWFVNTLSDEQKVANICASVQSASASAVKAVVKKNPDTAQYFAISAEAVEILVGQNTLDPKAIQAAITDALAGTEEVYKDAVLSTLNTAITVYSFFWTTNIDSKSTIVQQSCKKILIALCDGIKIGAGDTALAGVKQVKGTVKPLDKFTVEDLTLTK